MMSIRYAMAGNAKISLISDYDGLRHDKSIAKMVAEAFVEPPTGFCTHIIMLDGNLENVVADNLAWRPAWFAWRYTHQLKLPQPNHFKNLMVRDVDTGKVYNSIIEAGMTEGLLFDDIWRSTYSGARIYPNGIEFEVVT